MSQVGTFVSGTRIPKPPQQGGATLLNSAAVNGITAGTDTFSSRLDVNGVRFDERSKVIGRFHIIDPLTKNVSLFDSCPGTGIVIVYHVLYRFGSLSVISMYRHFCSVFSDEDVEIEHVVDGFGSLVCNKYYKHFCGIFPDEDIEIELVEEEPPFLKGHGRAGMDLSPIRIVKVQC